MGFTLTLQVDAFATQTRRLARPTGIAVALGPDRPWQYYQAARACAHEQQATGEQGSAWDQECTTFLAAAEQLLLDRQGSQAHSNMHRGWRQREVIEELVPPMPPG